MKKITLLITLIISSIIVSAQTEPTVAPYLRFPTYPPVKLLLPDSVSYFSKSDLEKKSTVLLMVFNPQCDHCQHETEDLLKHIDTFNHVQIVMATMMPFTSMLEFREKYHLDQYPNIIVGQDQQYFLPSFYQLNNLPFLAFYNKKKQLISVHEGSMKIERIVEELNR